MTVAVPTVTTVQTLLQVPHGGRNAYYYGQDLDSGLKISGNDLGDTSADRRGLMGEISLRHQFQSSRAEGWLSVFNTVDMIRDPFTDFGSKVLTQSDSGNRSPELVQYPPPVTSQAFPESSP
ncbi:hypothetical protein M422DRAFT_786018 [Sphaerobolus stellatus SS14]|uniref:Uncharacterized protein n=1 Tax=Sphaerobolus stellatus (strain SS14) TaxID=990650 RepID=A0A0C9UFK4_SPHS4|nr:hypothetical protein M422DRAFT_786018 [Sphaerobolus stellatus SS14]